ncbi:Hypothetical predicted protein, partial [Mytilus galloprovincialis]
MNTNILFDEGAQRSFVTEELASKLDIKAVGLRLAHPITNDDKFSISLLIGADFYWDFIEDTVIRGKGPTAVKSKLGYLLSGPTSPDMNRKSGAVGMFNILTNHKPEEFNLEAFWKLESLGVVDVEPEDENIDFMNMYQKTSVEFRKNRYVAKLPWKQDHETLPTNYVITKQRTHNVVKRLSQDPNMLQTYDKIIKDQERRGFIERVEDPDKAIGQVHYIPHHPVKKDSTTTPIRIVYDCSCRQSRQLPSLNDCLLSTPPILNDLTTLLVRFRLNPVAIVTDIEKAFLHVGLHEEDRDVTRFLWLSDPKDPRSHLTTYRFKSVLFGATCSPFILNAVLLKHLQKEGSQTAKILERDLYVDNILSSVIDENEALNYFTEARQLMLKAGFNLRSWTSNNEQLRQQAAKEDVLDTDKQTKILGMRWNVENDELTYAKRTIVPAQGDENSITK